MALAAFRDEGYLPDAMANALALLGWGPPDEVEIRPMAEIVDCSRWRRSTRRRPCSTCRNSATSTPSTSKPSGAEFTAAAEPWLTSDEAPWPADAFDSAVVEALAPEVQQRISKLDEAAGWLTWLFVRPTEFDEKSWSKAMVKGRAADRVLDEVIAALDGDDFSDAGHRADRSRGGDALTEALDARVMSQAPVRVALTGGERIRCGRR